LFRRISLPIFSWLVAVEVEALVSMVLAVVVVDSGLSLIKQ
jgi:hypothetical protein